MSDQTKVLSLERPSSVLSQILQFSDRIQRVREHLLTSFSFWLPTSSALLSFGVLFGQLERFPQEMHEYFIDSGIIHVVAASGYNVTLVIIVLQHFLMLQPVRKITPFLIIFCIGIYCLLAGASPSVIRAGIMGGLMVMARLFGRKYSAAHALFITILIMLLIQPLLIWSLSFLLSVVATLGLLIFSQGDSDQSTDSSYSFSIKSVVSELGTAFRTTMAASILTVPLIITVFGRLSIVSLLSNTLLLWMIPIIMLIAAVYLCAQHVHILLGLIIALPLRAVTQLFLYAVQLFASIPYASVEYEVPWYFLPLSYACIFGVYFFKKRSKWVKRV